MIVPGCENDRLSQHITIVDKLLSHHLTSVPQALLVPGHRGRLTRGARGSRGLVSSPEGLRENLRFCVCHQFATRANPLSIISSPSLPSTPSTNSHAALPIILQFL